MKRILGFSFVVVMLAMATGCAAQSQCMKQVDELQAVSKQQDQQIADLEARQMKLSAEKATGNLAVLGNDALEMMKAAWGWSEVEIPAAVKASHEKYLAARKCYDDAGGVGSAHTAEEYKNLAAKCLLGQQ